MRTNSQARNKPEKGIHLWWEEQQISDHSWTKFGNSESSNRPNRKLDQLILIKNVHRYGCRLYLLFLEKHKGETQSKYVKGPSIMRSAIKEQAQPKVELVNTRASKESNMNRSDDLCNTTIDSARAGSNCGGPSSFMFISPYLLLRCISLCEKLQQSKLFEREKIPLQSASISRMQSKSTSKTTVRTISFTNICCLLSC
jgi:hypothetical protein